ncbi:MAG: response regulator [Acidobacteria bacterium]|nr:response regulator [Acidobacteriota bacterium]
MKNTAEAPPFSIGRVAVVDDDPRAAEMLHTFFRLMDVDSVLIPPVEDAAELTAATICRERVDAVLLDFDLPNLRALDIVTHVRLLAPALPIVLVTEGPDNTLPPIEGVLLARRPSESFEELLQLMEIVLAALET